MDIDKLLAEAKKNWKSKNTLPEIIIRMGKVFGDICRYARNYEKDQPILTEDELKKELGNIIFSTIKWCDDLGYDPKECIEIAKKCQKNPALKQKGKIK